MAFIYCRVNSRCDIHDNRDPLADCPMNTAYRPNPGTSSHFPILPQAFAHPLWLITFLSATRLLSFHQDVAYKEHMEIHLWTEPSLEQDETKILGYRTFFRSAVR